MAMRLRHAILVLPVALAACGNPAELAKGSSCPVVTKAAALEPQITGFEATCRSFGLADSTPRMEQCVTQLSWAAGL